MYAEKKKEIRRDVGQMLKTVFVLLKLLNGRKIMEKKEHRMIYKKKMLLAKITKKREVGREREREREGDREICMYMAAISILLLLIVY